MRSTSSLTGILFVATVCFMLGGPSTQSNGAVAQTLSEQAPHEMSLITVGPNVQISASMPSKMHGEGLIVADPTNVKRLLVCSMFREPEMGEGVAVYVSEDGGTQWQRTFESGAEDHASDPACAFGPDGVAYHCRTASAPSAAAAAHSHHVARSAAAPSTSARVASGGVWPVSASRLVTCGTTHTSRKASTSDVVPTITAG